MNFILMSFVCLGFFSGKDCAQTCATFKLFYLGKNFYGCFKLQNNLPYTRHVSSIL